MNCNTKYTIANLCALSWVLSLGTAGVLVTSTAFFPAIPSVSASPVLLPAASRTWTTDGFVPDPHRLIGLGCGPERLTYTAEEEDHLPPPCYLVGTMDEMCPVPDGEYPPNMVDCALFLGDGW